MQGADSIANRFSRQELLATGGMAKVHIALDNTTGDRVVWKEAHDQYNPLQVSNSKLAEEAGLLQKAPHHRMPQFIDHGQFIGADGNQVGVLIIDYIEGGDLKNTVEQVTKMGMRLPTEKVIELVRAVCEPLEFLATLPVPIYHRDLKPQNLIVHPTRGPVLIDFGLAKEVATGQDMSVTRGGSGTWTAPERDAGISGPFTDVYSLGKILYFLCTSEQPPAILDQERVEALFSESGHTGWLAGFVLWACWPQHEKRMDSVNQFRVLLQNEGVWPAGVVDTIASAASDDYTTWG
jgi:serine/threonine protein kinase